MEMAIYDVFKKAGIQDDQARDIAATIQTNVKTAISEAIEQHYAVYSKELATRGDTENIRLDVEKIRLEIEKVRAEIEKSKSETIKWNIGAIIAAAGVAMAIARLFFTAG